MIKIIQLNVSDNYLHINNHYEQQYKWHDLKNNPIIQSQNFERTLASIGSTNILDLKKRSSWTHKLQFVLNFPSEATQFFEQNNIQYKDNYFSLLKYETGDFFLNHCDTDLSNALDNLIHQYTCLIFCPYGEDGEDLEGGELILKHPDRLYDIKVDSSVKTNNNQFVMVIFSIDMYHEVLPIISGSRYVFKKPLFVKRSSTIIEVRNDVNADDLCDGGGCDFGFSTTGDY